MKYLRAVSGWLATAALLAVWFAAGTRPRTPDGEQSRVPGVAADAKSQSGAGCPSSEEEARSDGQAVREALVKRLENKDNPAGVVSACIEALRHPNSGKLKNAKQILEFACREYPADVVSACMEALRNPDLDFYAKLILEDVCTENAACVVSAGRDALRNPDPDVRKSAIQALYHVRKCPEQETRFDALKILFDFCGDADDEVRKSAIAGFAGSVVWARSRTELDLARKALESFGEEFDENARSRLADGMLDCYCLGTPAKDKSTYCIATGPDAYERALDYFSEMSESEAEATSAVAGEALHKLLTEGFPSVSYYGGYNEYYRDRAVASRYFGLHLPDTFDGPNRYDGLPIDEAAKAAKARYRECCDAAKAVFPDDSHAELRYRAAAWALDEEAWKRFGDTPKAKEWLDTELKQTALRIDRDRAEK